MRVLAADDDESILNTLVRCLRSWEYEVVTAADGIQAWEILKNGDCPRVVVLDWDMPGLSGLEVCRLLRAAPHGREIYILMLTGRQEKSELVEALEAGMDDFLVKPFHARELQLRLANGVAAQARRSASSAPPSTSVPSATILGGKYRIEERIAEGGMASVWRGVHLSLGIDVAIKFMKPDVAGMPDYASFEREARAAAQLRGEHIVRVYDHGIAHHGAPYLVMELLPGESLGDAIERCGPLPPAEVAVVVEQIARALAEAHSRGVIHRDVKPDNIFIVEDPDKPFGCAKLVDFGLARRVTSKSTDGDDVISGTPSYMTPEHLRGRAQPNPALDLWGLAASAFTALTGAIAFDGDSVAEIAQRLCKAPLPVPSSINPALTPGIDAWFARACARAPADRFQTPAELASAFVQACGDMPPSARSIIAPHVRSFAPTQVDSTRMQTPAEESDRRLASGVDVSTKVSDPTAGPSAAKK